MTQSSAHLEYMREASRNSNLQGSTDQSREETKNGAEGELCPCLHSSEQGWRRTCGQHAGKTVKMANLNGLNGRCKARSLQ
jgi:hypothetical protein